MVCVSHILDMSTRPPNEKRAFDMWTCGMWTPEKTKKQPNCQARTFYFRYRYAKKCTPVTTKVHFFDGSALRVLRLTGSAPRAVHCTAVDSGGRKIATVHSSAQDRSTRPPRFNPGFRKRWGTTTTADDDRCEQDERRRAQRGEESR